MKKIFKFLAMLCMVAFVGAIYQPIEALAASGYITTQPLSCYSYEAQTGSISFYADCNWKAEVTGYPGMVTFTSSSSGGSGSRYLDFKLAENTQNYDKLCVILIKDANTGAVICYADINQEGKNKQQSTSEYFKNLTSLKENGSTYIKWNETSLYLEFESNCNISVTFDGSKVSMYGVKQADGSTRYYGSPYLGYNYDKSTQFHVLKVNIDGNKVVGGKERTFYIYQERTPVVTKLQVVGNRFDAFDKNGTDMTYKITTNDDFYLWYTYYDKDGKLVTTSKEKVEVNIPYYAMQNGTTFTATYHVTYKPKKIFWITASAALYVNVHIQGVHGGKDTPVYIGKMYNGLD